MNHSFTWYMLDYISDAYNPLLFFIALLLTVRLFMSHKMRQSGKLFVLLSLGLLSVYTLMWADERYQLWPSLGLDYSTHTAFAFCMVWVLNRAIIKKHMLLVLLWVSLFSYFVLMIFQGYHSIADIFLHSSCFYLHYDAYRFHIYKSLNITNKANCV